jgi:electron transfer flavoprotein beta subunit
MDEGLMRIIVCVKQLRHTYARTGRELKKNYLNPEDNITRVNPYDEIAVELALRMKELLGGGEIIVLTLGPIIARAELNRCLAMGADRHCNIQVNGAQTDLLDPWSKSGFLARAIKDIKGDLVLCGKESLDNQNGQVAAFVSHRLDLPFVSAITDLKISDDHCTATVLRSAGRGVREVIECALPAVLSVDVGSCDPRLPTLEDKKRAKSLPMQMLSYEPESELPKKVVEALYPPRPRPKHVPLPDSQLGGFHRIIDLLKGSSVEKKGAVLKGSTESQVEGIISFLEENEFLATKKVSAEK